MTDEAVERPMTLQQQRDALFSTNHTLVQRLAEMRERLREAEEVARQMNQLAQRHVAIARRQFDEERERRVAAQERAEKAEAERDERTAEIFDWESGEAYYRLERLETENERLREGLERIADLRNRVHLGDQSFNYKDSVYIALQALGEATGDQ